MRNYVIWKPYVLHLLIIFSFGCAVFKILIQYFSYHIAFLIMFSATMTVILLMSTLVYYLVDAFGMKVSNALHGYVLRLRRHLSKPGCPNDFSEEVPGR